MKFLLAIVRVLPLILICGTACANNNGFLPGDAFFPTELTSEDVGRLDAKNANSLIFDYSPLGGYEMAFCGYAGYFRARLPNLGEPFVRNLRKAYDHVRENYEERKLIETRTNGKTTLRETNGVRVLFYPEEFEFPKRKLGLQYNEGWVEEVMKFGHPRGMMRLCCLVHDADAIMESWRDAKDVPGLQAELPQLELKPVPETLEPITILRPVKAYVLDSRPLIRYFNPPEDDVEHIGVVCVSSTGIEEVSYKDGEWKRDEVEP